MARLLAAEKISRTAQLQIQSGNPETGAEIRELTDRRQPPARDDEALSAIRTETEDRYGRIPEAVENLFAYARLRQTAEQLGIISIDRTRDGMAVKMAEKARVAPEKLMELVSQRSGASFTPSGVLRLELDEEEKDHALEVARRVLLQIRADG